MVWSSRRAVGGLQGRTGFEISDSREALNLFNVAVGVSPMAIAIGESMPENPVMALLMPPSTT